MNLHLHFLRYLLFTVGFFLFFNLRSHHNGIPLPENKTFSGLFGSNRIFTVKQVLVALGRKTDGLLDGSENS